MVINRPIFVTIFSNHTVIISLTILCRIHRRKLGQHFNLKPNHFWFRSNKVDLLNKNT